jgi:hypothetical protein
MIVQARLYFAYLLAEAQHDTQFVRLDPKETGKSPKSQYAERDESKAATAQIAARQDATQSVLATAQDFLEIGWSRPR